MKYFILFFSILSLSGCGSSSSEGTPASMSDIIGVWDFTEDFGSLGQDEAYLVILSSGASFVYDYQGDSFNNEENCYSRHKDYHLTDLGNGQFEFTDDYDTLIGKITLTNTSMTIDYSEAHFYTYQKSNRLESDLTPLCSTF